MHTVSNNDLLNKEVNFTHHSACQIRHLLSISTATPRAWLHCLHTCSCSLPAPGLLPSTTHRAHYCHTDLPETSCFLWIYAAIISQGSQSKLTLQNGQSSLISTPSSCLKHAKPLQPVGLLLSALSSFCLSAFHSLPGKNPGFMLMRCGSAKGKGSGRTMHCICEPPKPRPVTQRLINMCNHLENLLLEIKIMYFT